MQTNDMKALIIPEGNVLSVYGKGPSVFNRYPVVNTFNPNDYEKETEVEIITAVFRSYKALVGKSWTATIALTNGTLGTDGYVPILYDRMNGVVINVRFVWSSNKPEHAQVIGHVL